MKKFGDYRNSELPLDLVERAKASATREISDFSVSLISRQEVLGSGTLVRADGKVGILTAYHVAEVISERKEPIGVNISEQVHQFVLEPTCMEHRPVAIPENLSAPGMGPDLAVIKLLDVRFLSTLQSRKSCYRLDERSFDEFSDLPIERMPWWVMGAPAEFSTHEGALGTGGHILGAIHFAAEATLVAFEDREPFDFLKLRVTSGTHGFPSSFGGVSGGGIWLAPLTMDPEVGVQSIGYAPPFLSGVAYYQGELSEGERAIIGHGPNSIYRHAREALTRS